MSFKLPVAYLAYLQVSCTDVYMCVYYYLMNAFLSECYIQVCMLIYTMVVPPFGIYPNFLLYPYYDHSLFAETKQLGVIQRQQMLNLIKK